MAAVPYDIRNLPGLERGLEDEEALPFGMEVDIAEPGLGAGFEELADGGIAVDMDGTGQPANDAGDPEDHYANIAEFLDQNELGRIGQEVCEAVKADIESREDWNERLAKGLEVLGIKMPTDADMGALKIAKAIHHPLLAEALVQFQARAYSELFPPGGPAKGTVLGKRTRERIEQADRVESFLNYQLTLQDRPYYEESDQLLFMLGMEGSQFRKVYRDPLLKRNVARWVRAEHFVVPYGATSLETTPRYTHILRETKNDVLKRMRAGYYVQEELQPPQDSDAERTNIQVAKDEAEGKSPSSREEDAEYTTYETHIELDIKGFEDVDDLGRPTGVALPYVVCVDRDTEKVRAIYRNWKERDEDKTKRVWFSHYKYLPGTGFYGFGLLHMIGGLSNAATAILRLIVIGAGYAGAQGGFKTKEGRGLPSSVQIEVGTWKEVDASAEELSKGFWTPPFKEPAEALFKVLGLIQELSQRFASTTESMVGDAKNTGPVGTTVALIEQGSKVFSGIHKRCHVALGYELRLLAELNGEYTPEEGYPYEVPGASQQVFRQDFDERVDVEPVSDPNIYSSTQRIALAQAGVQMADAAPDLVDRREAYRRMFEAMRTPDVDAILPDKQKIQRCDPVTENSFAMVGKPVRVYPEQNHDAHISVHMGALQLAQGPAGEIMRQALLAHVAEHEAYRMRLMLSQDMGMQLPPIDLYADGSEDEPVTQELPPQLENMIAMRAAQVMQALTAQLGQAQQAAAKAPGEQAQSDAEKQAESEQARKDQASQKDEERKDMKIAADIDRQDAMAGIDPATVKGAQDYLSQRGLDRAITPRQLAVVSRALGRSFDDTVRLIMASGAGGQGSGPAPYASGLGRA